MQQTTYQHHGRRLKSYTTASRWVFANSRGERIGDVKIIIRYGLQDGGAYGCHFSYSAPYLWLLVRADVMCRGPDYSRPVRSQQCHHDGSV